jgi:hypothetical protein
MGEWTDYLYEEKSKDHADSFLSEQHGYPFKRRVKEVIKEDKEKGDG